MNNKQGFNNNLNLIFSQSKILIVGAGGIGCELMKNLYKTRNKITIMDYDTISQTNLNRQFCFRKQDIGKHKVDVLYKYFLNMNPSMLLHIQKSNLFEYDSVYFSQFDLVISALDNNQARCYLNKMAIDQHIPMIDAGTAGYNGQVQNFIRHKSQCRMCRPQTGQDIGYAVCSLRGKPQRNIHCIQFALNLYAQIGNIHRKIQKINENIQKQNANEQQAQQWSTLSRLFVKKLSQYKQQQLKQVCKQLHDMIFSTYISNYNLQEVEPKSYPSNINNLNKIADMQINKQQILAQLQSIQYDLLLNCSQFNSQFYSILFVQSLQKLLLSDKFNEYDKDNFMPSVFIYSAANIRIINFRNTPHSRLKTISYYEARDMSGKIIPAIASTNSIAAALQVLSISKVAHSAYQPKYITIKSYLSAYKVESLQFQKPKPSCQFCSYLYNYAQIEANFSLQTWGRLQQFLINRFQDQIQNKDMRCEQFVLIRNTGKPWNNNKYKLLNFNQKLIKKSKLQEKQIITIKYIPNCQISRQSIRAKENHLSSWKFVLINQISQQKFKAKKSLTKQQYKQNYANTLQQITNMKEYELNKEQLNQSNVLYEQIQ